VISFTTSFWQKEFSERFNANHQHSSSSCVCGNRKHKGVSYQCDCKSSHNELGVAGSMMLCPEPEEGGVALAFCCESSQPQPQPRPQQDDFVSSWQFM
jgi:hypothetical protein